MTSQNSDLRHGLGVLAVAAVCVLLGFVFRAAGGSAEVSAAMGPADLLVVLPLGVGVILALIGLYQIARALMSDGDPAP